MVYYSHEARESFLKVIEDLRKKVACIPGQYLDYTSANQLSRCLDDLESFIKQEDKEYYHAD